MSGLLRAPEGTVVAGILEKIKEAFPKAKFENATELLQDARSVKGPEEVAWMERAAEILDKSRRVDSGKSQTRSHGERDGRGHLADDHRQRR